ncbi:MAG: molybdate ABC transporter substrate-binding protein [Oscillospiraceae bacterium]|nr:molybdate ABC transporter substrate-binding protein [Oscillospiraceae bacterium]
MRRKTAFALALTLLLSLLTGCAAKGAADEPADEPAELIVFAAASMKETLTLVGENYKTVAPNVKLTFSFDSSGTLKTQIQEGADCDVFISAAPKQMNQLDAAAGAEKNPDGLDFVMQGTRRDLLENKVTLVVPEGNPKNVTSFDQLPELLRSGDILLAVGNSDVPVGQYTQKIFAYYGIDETAAAKSLTYGSNVKEVTSQVAAAAVDCGIVYATDAFSAGLAVVDEASAEMCGRVIYPAAVLNTTKHEKEAKAFLDYLAGADAAKVFDAVGFTPLG